MSKGFNILKFRSRIDKNTELNRAAHFKVTFTTPKGLRKSNMDSDILSFYCKSSVMPGLGILTSDNYRYGYGPIERKPYGTVFNDAMVTLYVDGNNVVKSWFTLWTQLITNYRADKGMESTSSINGAKAFEFSYKEDYAVDITISAYNGVGRETNRVVITEAFPNYIGDISMDWEMKNQVVILPVSLTFRDWYDEKVVNPRPSSGFGLLSDIQESIEGIGDILGGIGTVSDIVANARDTINDIF